MDISQRALHGRLLLALGGCLAFSAAFGATSAAAQARATINVSAQVLPIAPARAGQDGAVQLIRGIQSEGAPLARVETQYAVVILEREVRAPVSRPASELPPRQVLPHPARKPEAVISIQFLRN